METDEKLYNFSISGLVRYLFYTESVFTIWLVGKGLGWLTVSLCILLIFALPFLFKKVFKIQTRNVDGDKIIYKVNKKYNILRFAWAFIVLSALFFYAVFYLKTGVDFNKVFSDTATAAVYMLGVNILCAFYFLYEALRHVNDSIVLSKENVMYRYKKNTISLPLKSMYKAQELHGNILILMTDETTQSHIIPTEEMGFMGIEDLQKKIAKEIDRLISEANREDKAGIDTAHAGNSVDVPYLVPNSGIKNKVINSVVVLVTVLVLIGVIYLITKLQSWINNSSTRLWERIFKSNPLSNPVSDKFGAFEERLGLYSLIIVLIVVMGKMLYEIFKKKSSPKQ